MGGQIEILFPIAEVDDPKTKAWYVDGGANQSWSPLAGSGGSFAPGAIPHQIGTDTILASPPPEEPPPPPAGPQCLSDFAWGYNVGANGLLLPLTGHNQTNQVDQYGNFYVRTDTATLVFNSSGVVIASLTRTWLEDGVDAWFGSPVVHRGSAPTTFTMTPILNGQYIIAHFEALASLFFSFWYVILQPSASGPPTVLGAVYYESLLGPPYVRYLQFMGIANRGTIDDPIMIRGAFGIGALSWTIALLPSISAIINGTYKAAGFGTYHLPCKVPPVRYYPIGNVNFSHNLSAVPYPSGVDFNIKSGFVLPSSSGGTNVYFYINRQAMDYHATHNDATTWTEVRNVLQPAYSTGCIVKINMGVLDYQTAASFAFTHAGSANASGTGMYAVDNAAWNDGASAQIPFTDEYTYLSNDTGGGTDDYVVQPGMVLDRGNGIYWILFYMVGQTDAVDHSLNRLYERIRIFQYNSSTEIATQILKATCVLYENTNVPLGTDGGAPIEEQNQAWSISDVGGLVTLRVNGYTLCLHTTAESVYKTAFLQFTP